ncbi:MAG: OmpA family protein [Nitrospira sp.]|nr:OmpA family protein [Nitrospira sp.]MCP9462854.1 OmpA family protein [Nitrospira sp.]MCP9474860.1 OmpA family protein [Nitrospira sp.]
MAKHKHEEHENHERWLVSYADFITLLFAFFVVMYSVSAVNEGKFRTVSESIRAALRPVSNPEVSQMIFSVGQYRPAMKAPSLPGSKELAVRRLRDLVKSSQTSSQFALIHMLEKEDGDIIITIPDNILFKSGEAAIRQEALSFLKGLASALLELNRHVRVEGHTDNVPIRTAQFPSNWELSATRAVMVVRVLSELYGVPSDHLAAVGYADTRPVASNLTPDQRAKNRRVEVIILEHAPAFSPRFPEDGQESFDQSSSGIESSPTRPFSTGFDLPKSPDFQQENIAR